MFGSEKLEEGIEELKKLNKNLEFFKKYVQDHQLGEAFNEGIDEMSMIRQIFAHIGKIEGGMGVANALFQGLQEYAKKRRS
jgi:hypothetical protein